MERIDLDEAALHLEDFVARVEAGEGFEIVRNDKVAARLVSATFREPFTLSRVFDVPDAHLAPENAGMTPSRSSPGGGGGSPQG